MNSKIFYSNKKIRDLERPFLNPELSEDSDLSSESDESIYIYILVRVKKIMRIVLNFWSHILNQISLKAMTNQ